jgi:hypothetical protein
LLGKCPYVDHCTTTQPPDLVTTRASRAEWQRVWRWSCCSIRESFATTEETASAELEFWRTWYDDEPHWGDDKPFIHVLIMCW